MTSRTVVANIALPPLPGSHNYRSGGIEQVIEKAVEEARLIDSTGYDGVLLQNSGDGLFTRDGFPETIAYLTAIGAAVKRDVRCQVGFNILSVGGPQSLSVAHAVGGDFVRIKIYVGAVATDAGVVNGSYREVLDQRRRIGAERIRLVADVHDRSTWPVSAIPLTDAARIAAGWGQADVLVITGRSVDDSLGKARDVRAALSDTEMWCGGGATADNVATMLDTYDGVIVGLDLHTDSDYAKSFDPERVKQFISAARAAMPESA